MQSKSKRKHHSITYHILFDKGPDGADEVTIDDDEAPSPLPLSKEQLDNVCRHSTKFRELIERDTHRGKTTFRIRHNAGRCTPRLIKQLIMMLATSRGTWPAGLPKEGNSLVELYVGFHVFDCSFTLLRRSDAFKQASDHLIFCQDPEDTIIKNEPCIHALVIEIQRNTCKKIKKALKYQMDQLATDSPESHSRLQTALQNAGFMNKLAAIDDLGYPYPVPLQITIELLEILESTMRPSPGLDEATGSHRGPGIGPLLQNAITKMKSKDRKQRQTQLDQEKLDRRNKALQTFGDEINLEIKSVGVDAWNMFCMGLQRDWEDAAGERPLKPSSRGSSASLHDSGA